MTLSIRLWLLFTGACCTYSCVSGTCLSPQYLEMGKLGLINCSFNEEFIGVLWYNTTDYLHNDPIVHYQNSKKSGSGYDSGEYDVHANGSLIISNVSLHHNRTFKFACVYPRTLGPVVGDVNITVVVKSSLPYPIFEQCETIENPCYLSGNISFIQCSISDVRPAVTPMLMTRTVAGDRNLSSSLTITFDGDRFTSNIIAEGMGHNRPALELLLCRAFGLPGILEANESFMLFQKEEIGTSFQNIIPKYVLQGDLMELKCTTDTKKGFLVWKKKSHQNKDEEMTILYSIFLKHSFSRILTSGFMLSRRSYLVVPQINLTHEAIYTCTFGDGLSNERTSYDVRVAVPEYPVINGCFHQQHCTLGVRRKGYLSCKAEGIRPKIVLEFRTLYGSNGTSITFENRNMTIIDNGETYDVYLRIRYKVVEKRINRLPVECRFSEPAGVFRNFWSTATLVFIEDEESNEYQEKSKIRPHVIWISITVAVLSSIVCLCCGIIHRKIAGKKKKVKEDEGNGEEMQAMVHQSHTTAECSTGKRDQFLKEIKDTYRRLNAVKPIPFRREEIYSVQRIFVEGGIEFCRDGNWCRLQSYKEIFSHSELKSKRRILMGEPGYGKTFITLQIAHDWCQATSVFHPNAVDVLILLRLRQLKNVTSIYEAIKRFILPKESQLNENDIREILANSASVLILLDGFDEYPHRTENSTYDVISIITCKMFRDFEVVLTTRTACLPMDYPVELTKLIRLTGFDDVARRCYIKKIVGENAEYVEELERHLRVKAILKDLSQNPLLFAIIVHIFQKDKQIRKSTSVTEIFNCMVEAFRSHLSNKGECRNACDYEKYKLHLEKTAFEALNGESQNIVWKKDEMCDLVCSETFYNYLLRLGILSEEETFDPNEKVFKTEVRFYHNIFCEWYAAHYARQYVISHSNVDFADFLQQMHPLNLQFFYRFFSGLHTESSVKIFQYLQTFEGGAEFALLCSLETPSFFDIFKEEMHYFCSTGVMISRYDSHLLRRSCAQLLETATANKITVSKVVLYHCVEKVKPTEEVIKLSSDIDLKSSTPMRELGICLSNTTTTKDEATEILTFCSGCHSLEHIWFQGSAPPTNFNCNSVLSTLSNRRSRLRVEYFGMDLEGPPECILNLETGRWQKTNDDTECTEEDFNIMNKRWQDRVWTEENARDFVFWYRKQLSQLARSKDS